MSGLSAWVLSIAGVCLLSVIVDLITPEGKTNSSIKNVFAYAMVLVVVLPLPSLINSNFSIQDVFSVYEIEIQDGFIYNLNQAKLDGWGEAINNELNQRQIYGAVVSISANIFDINMQVDAVYVDLYNVVITDKNTNINIKTEVTSVVLKYVDIAEDKVVFYE